MNVPIPRRKALQLLGIAGTSLTPVARSSAQTGGAGALQRPQVLVQIADTSPAQIDVSKDFLTGSRAAWQDFNARGGLRGRPVQVLTLEIDGQPASVRNALEQARDNPACLALVGTVADTAAAQVAALLKRQQPGLAHVAPWLQDGTEAGDETFTVFARHDAQIAHALKSLSVIGVRELTVIYASEQIYALNHSRLERTAADLKLKLRGNHPNGADARALGQRLPVDASALILFLGGTPELASFTQGLEKQARGRYVIGLADVNLQTLAQMGAARHTPVIVTQVVPVVTSALPVVRAYRQVLSRLFDEPPTPQSLAGYLSARYAQEVLAEIEGPLNRVTVLTAFQRRATVDLGGFSLGPAMARSATPFVTQSMLSSDGRVIG